MLRPEDLEVLKDLGNESDLDYRVSGGEAPYWIEVEPKLDASLEDLEPLKEGQEFRIPQSLYSYQVQDVDRIRKAGQNFLILSEMGVGKTPEVISVVEMEKFKRVLVLCPKSLRLEWGRQIVQWTGIEPIICRRGSSKRLDPLFESIQNGGSKSPYFILNYDTFRIDRHIDILKLISWDCIVMDEVHHLRNPETKATVGVKKFLESQKQALVLPMTGSPVVNSPLDMYTILSLIKPVLYTRANRIEFLDKYTYWSPRRNRPKILGVRRERMAEFHKSMEPFSVRRLKEDVLPFLPAKTRRVVLLDMEDEQAELYRKMATDLVLMLDEGESISAPSVLALLIRLRQLNLDPAILGIDAPSSKTEFLLDLIKDGPSKLVVFSTFERYIRYISRILERMGIQHVSITGKTGADQIARNVQTFQNDPHCQVALGTIKVMGEGITLTAASDVVLMDRWWTPTANNQAVDRLHRPGQHSPVQIILPTNSKSIDQSLDAILEGKAGITDSLLNEASIMQEVTDDLRRMAMQWV